MHLLSLIVPNHLLTGKRGFWGRKGKEEQTNCTFQLHNKRKGKEKEMEKKEENYWCNFDSINLPCIKRKKGGKKHEKKKGR